MTRGTERINGDGMHTIYPRLRDEIMASGAKVSPRGEPTLELLGVAFSVRDAVNRGVPLGCGRKVGVKMQAIDGTGNLSGTSYPDVAIKLAGVMERFSDVLPAEGEHPDAFEFQDRQPNLKPGAKFFQGAYGPRMGDQLIEIEHQLRRDRDSRQACVNLWSETDRDPAWKDRPCTPLIQFMIREGALDVFVGMRANDLWTGTCYDVWQFGQLQAAMAHVLDIPYGTYHHYATSLHIYERDFEKFEAVQQWKSSTEPAVNNPRESWGPDWDALEPRTYRTWPQIRARFTEMLEGARGTVDFTPDNPVESWYWDILKTVRPE